MELRDYDEKCVRITDTLGDVYEGRATYFNRDYVFHEYGCDQEALGIIPNGTVFLKERVLTEVLT